MVKLLSNTDSEYITRKNTIGRIIFVGILLIVMLMCVFVFVRDRISVVLVDNIQTELTGYARQNASYVEDKIENIMSSMHHAAEDLSKEDFQSQAYANLSDRPLEEKPLALQHVYTMGELDKFSYIGLIDIYGNGLEGPSLDLQENPGIRGSLRGGDRLIYMPYTSFGYQNALVFSVPVKRGERITGSLYGVMDARVVQDAFNISFYNGKDETLLIDGNGRLFAQPRDGVLAEQLQGYLIGWQLPDTRSELVNLYTKVRQDNWGVERITLPNGEKYYLACVSLKGLTDVYMVNILPDSVVKNRVNSVLDGVSYMLEAVLFLLILAYGWTEWRENKSREKLNRLAYMDSLTRLGNREKMFKDVKTVIQNGGHLEFSAISLNIRNMKVINNFWGYEYGDSVMRRMATLLLDECQENEMCYRGNADIFFLWWQESEAKALEERLKKVLERVTESFVKQDSHVIHIAAGVCLLKDYFAALKEHDQMPGDLDVDYQSAEKRKEWSWKMVRDVFSRARFAARMSGSENANTINFYDSNIVQKMAREKELEDSFQQAMADREFKVFLQPKYIIRGDTPVVASAEALVRWISDKFGFLPPNEFIPLFARNGNLEILDRYVLERVCEQQREWLDKGYEIVPISVNVTRRNIANGKRFADATEEILRLYNIDKKYIELEVLESDASVDESTMIDFLYTLRTRGFKIAMDDFGSGYSSLGLLSRMPIDCLKLDKSLFDNWTESMTDKDFSLVKHTIEMAHETGRIVVAEGIEEGYQVDILRTLECDYVQGYHFCKPVPTDEFEKKLVKKIDI